MVFVDSILKCYIDIPFDYGSVHIRLIGVRIHVISTSSLFHYVVSGIIKSATLRLIDDASGGPISWSIFSVEHPASYQTLVFCPSPIVLVVFSSSRFRPHKMLHHPCEHAFDG